MKEDMAKKETCPVTGVALLLSDTWTMLIIHKLLSSKKSMRFCELEQTLTGISTRTLTAKLKILSEKKIIKKDEQGYSLTKTGIQFKPVITAMHKIGKVLIVK
jgi:DNA-binding HxlR family transcriptional regulator